jgi:glycogen(starch) synthase
VLNATAFLGHLDHADLLDALQDADTVVLPSHYEPFGIVALEVAAVGTPLVTSNVGGLGEAVINGQTGMSFTPRDIAGLADAVRFVLDDPDAAQQRAVAARERLTSGFDWGTVATETAQVYVAAKRREREPLARPFVVDRALPER